MSSTLNTQLVNELVSDMTSFANFMYKPAGFKVARRLAPPVDTLQFYIDRFNSLNGDFSSSVSVALSSLNNSVTEAQGKVSYIETTVQDAISNTAVEGGVLADTFLTVTPNGAGTVARTQRDLNSNITYAKSFGAKGDGVTNDSDAINLAIVTLSNLAKADGQPRTLVFDPNCVYIARVINMQPLVNLTCLTGLATIKRTPVPEGTPESEAKWWRTLNSYGTDWVTDLDYSHRVEISNLIIDGNMYNSQWSFATYSQEQASNIFIGGENSSDSEKRVKFLLHNVHTQNSVSDGLHIWKNSDVIIKDCFADKCFRGGLTLTGGNTNLYLDGWHATDARCDMELDTDGSNGSRSMNIFMKNYYQDMDESLSAKRVFNGGIDIGSVGNNGIMDMYNVNVNSLSFDWYMGNDVNEIPKRYIIDNCFFRVYSAATYNPVAGLIKNTKFVFENRNGVHGKFDFYTDYVEYRPYNQDTEQNLVFDGCTFELASNALVDAISHPVISIASQKDISKSGIIFKNCDFSTIKTAGYLFKLSTGGRITLDNIKVNTPRLIDAAGAYSYEGITYPVDITFGHIDFGELCEEFMLAAFSDGSANVNKLTFKEGFTIPIRVNKFGANPQNGSPKIKIGHRTILSNTPPTYGVQAYEGDIFLLDTITIGQPYEWVATNDFINHGGEVAWRVTKWAFGSFATSELPHLTIYDVGTTNHDATLDKVVTWVGNRWI